MNTGELFVGNQIVNANMMFQIAGAQAIGTEAILSNLGGQTLVDLFSSTGVGLEIVSASVNDASAGTGLQTARLHGFDVQNHYMYEDITMNGTTDVATANLDWRSVFYIEGLTYGSGKKAAGHITVENLANNVYYLAIDANGTSSRRLSIYVPPNIAASYELVGWFTNDTTAYDAITVNHYTISTETNDTINLVNSIAKSAVADLDTENLRLSGVLKQDKINQIKGVDIGTTAQTINYACMIGFRYL